HRLVAICIDLLGGADPLPPAKLWAVTFTEKAAAELKGRIRARVDELAAQDPSWIRARRDLGLAQIGTIHALCGQILRRHAAAAGIDPGFAVLAEDEARALVGDACQAAFDEDARARRQFDRAMTELRGALQAAGRAVPPAPGPALEASAAGQLARAWRELRRASPWTLRAQGPEKELIVAARDAFAGVLNADAGVRGEELARDLAAL